MVLTLYSRIESNSESRTSIPSKPGIYRFVNEQDEIIYIGASKNFKKRVSQHFNCAINGNRKKDKIRKLTCFIEYQEHKSQESAFDAERIEIWTNHPPLNIRNNKVYSFSYIIFREFPFPHIICVDDCGKCDIRSEDRIIRINSHLNDLLEKINCIRKYYPICMLNNASSCWDIQINLCNNECNGNKHFSTTYSEDLFNEFLSIISTEENSYLTKLEKQLQATLSTYYFEKAKRVYEGILSIKGLQRRYGGISIIHDRSTFTFREILGDDSFGVEIKLFKGKKLVLERLLTLKFNNNCPCDILIYYFMQNFYQGINYCPKMIYTNIAGINEPKTTFINWMQRYYHQEVEIIEKRN